MSYDDAKAVPKMTIGCADGFHFKCEHKTRFAPSLAASYEVRAKSRNGGEINDFDGEVLAALRAFETVRAALSSYAGSKPWTTTSADCDHESCEHLAEVQDALRNA